MRDVAGHLQRSLCRDGVVHVQAPLKRFLSVRPLIPVVIWPMVDDVVEEVRLCLDASQAGGTDPADAPRKFSAVAVRKVWNSCPSDALAYSKHGPETLVDP